MMNCPVTKTRCPNRKSTAQQVHNGHEQLQAILDTAVEGIVVIDERGIIQTFNRAAARMFGYELTEVLGRNVSMLMPRRIGAEHDRYLASYFHTGQPKPIEIAREVTGVRKDGSTFPMELAISEVQNVDQRTFTGIIRDMSNRKRLERAILDVSEREQRRIGRDLHDGLCQELAGIAFLAQKMHRQCQTGKEVTESTAAEVAVLLQEAIMHARALARGLQPVEPLPNGLSAALAHLAADTAELHRVRCHLRVPRPVEISDSGAATHIYRIAQECVRNAVHHANAKNIAIGLFRRSDGMELSISDDVTRPLSAVFGGDMVHEMIHHRARMIGGQIVIRPRKGGGVRVTCQVPDLNGSTRHL